MSARPPRTHLSPVLRSPGAAGLRPSPERPPSVPGRGLSVRSRAGGCCWRPTRRTRRRPARRAARPWRCGGSSSRNRPAASTSAVTASDTRPQAEWILPSSRIARAVERGSVRLVLASASSARGSVDRPGQQVRLRCRQPSLGPPLAVRGQQRRAFEERGRGGVPATVSDAFRRRLLLGRDPFVRTGGGRGQVPGPGIGIQVRIARGREGTVRPPPLARGRRVVDRRPDERMGEPHLRPEGHQAGGLRGQRGRLRDGQRGGGLPQRSKLDPDGPPPPAATGSACPTAAPARAVANKTSSR